MVTCGCKKGHPNMVCSKERSICSKHVNRYNFGSQRLEEGGHITT